jgi:hypothetical protein
VTRDKAIVLTGIFLVNNVKKQEQRLLKDLEAFLGANSNFKMTLDEVAFILGRNGVTLVDLGQEFDCNTTATDFKTFIQELVALPKQLIANLSDVLFGFFKSRLTVEGVAVDHSSEVKINRRGKAPNKDLAEMFANAEKKFKQKVNTKQMTSGKEESIDLHAKEEASQKEEVEVKLLKDKLLKHQTERKQLEDKLQKLNEEKMSDSKEIESLKKNLKSNKDYFEQQLDDAHKEKEQRLFIEKKFIESLSLLLEGGDLVDEEFDAAQTKIVEKVKELMMQGQTRDEVGGGSATVETEKSSSSAGSSSESLEDSTGCSDADKCEVSVRDRPMTTEKS